MIIGTDIGLFYSPVLRQSHLGGVSPEAVAQASF